MYVCSTLLRMNTRRSDCMTYAECGRLGWKASKAVHAARHRANIAKYVAQPKLCVHCGVALPYEKRKHSFCNHKCAASHNNIGVRRHGNAPTNCKVCGNPTATCRATYCSLACFQLDRSDRLEKTFAKIDIARRIVRAKSVSRSQTRKVRFDRIEAAGRLSGNARLARQYLLARRPHNCEICKGTTWCGAPMPLVVDHIDGDYTNNTLVNLRLVCGNCDMQLPTYKGRNRGHGRFSRRQRYAAGKSY